MQNVISISLGHAHSLVLCTPSPNTQTPTTLYSFGSNHYGQLGLGQYYELDNISPEVLSRSLVPIEVFINQNIRLIHTKFFTNVSVLLTFDPDTDFNVVPPQFVVTESNELLTFGQSPQALRMQYQARKRARTFQKQEECNDKRTASPARLQKDKLFDEADVKLEKSDAEPSETGAARLADNEKTLEKRRSLSESELHRASNEGEFGGQKKADNNPNKQSSIDEESSEHYYPMPVDTQSVEGIVTNVSLRCFRFVFILVRQVARCFM